MKFLKKNKITFISEQTIENQLKFSFLHPKDKIPKTSATQTFFVPRNLVQISQKVFYQETLEKLYQEIYSEVLCKDLKIQNIFF
jgi:hypothetical protein